MFLMVECVKEELQAMKDGLNDVIPSDLLSGLTAEVCVYLVSVHVNGYCTEYHNIIARNFSSQIVMVVVNLKKFIYGISVFPLLGFPVVAVRRVS